MGYVKMSSRKILSDAVKLIFVDFENDQNGLRALRRINMMQVNLAKSGRMLDAKTVGELKKLFVKKREV